jgi:hypothetical protein
MGLWGSKQKRDIVIENQQIPGQIFVTEDAITNVLKTVQEGNSSSKASDANPSDQKSKLNEPVGSLKLSPDLHDKRINEYESTLVTNLENASRYVENLFRDRYQTIPVCHELQKSVDQCYNDNANRTLNCLDIANKFIKCVEEERQSRLIYSKQKN